MKVGDEDALDSPFERGDVLPRNGGCWFCHRYESPINGSQRRLFSMAMNSYFHESCAVEVGVADAPQPLVAYAKEIYAPE